MLLDINMKRSQVISSSLFLLTAAPVFGWIEASRSAQALRNLAGTVLKADNAAVPNPCWQDMYDDDCAMETIFSARYVPSDWIKNLPCAKGLEVCQSK
jgi:hypothetical protein